jgi:glycosyltransferase involved in cell wall biosynthesis
MINAEYPVGESRNLIQDVKDQIVRLGLGDAIEMDTGFLPDKVALSKLADCDLIVFGYQRSSESASGAVRYGLSSGRPVAVTPLEIFSDVADYCIQLPGISPAEIAQGIAGVMDRMASEDWRDLDAELEDMLDRSRAYVSARSYTVLGPRLKGMLTALWDDQQNGLQNTLL